MRITEVDAFYLAMAHTRPVDDVAQDTFLVRLRTNTGLEGWGESDSSPLVSMACYCCPPSHSSIVNLRDSLLGAQLDGVDALRRIRNTALRRAMGIQHVHHAFSAADIALWDLLGQHLQTPVYALLDGPDATAQPKRPYAPVVFGDTPERTRELAADRRAAGFDAVKFGWGPLGRDGRTADIALVRAARDGLGDDALLLIDAGCTWGEDADTARSRAADFAAFNVGWLEEPLQPEAIEAYASLTRGGAGVPIAAGESSGRLRDAQAFVVNGGINVVQIDTARIGGITPSHAVRRLADERDITYVNHTSKSHLSLAAALHVFATAEHLELCEYAVGGSPLAERLVHEPLKRAADGTVTLSDRPGLGVTINPETIRSFLQQVRITVGDVEVEAGAHDL